MIVLAAMEGGESPWHIETQVLGPDFPLRAADAHLVAGPSVVMAHPSEDIAPSGEVVQDHVIKCPNGDQVALWLKSYEQCLFSHWLNLSQDSYDGNRKGLL